VVTKPLWLALALAFCLDAGAADPYAPAAFGATTPSRSTNAAPPLPFRYVGRLSQNGKQEVLLMRGERLFSLAAGDKVGDDYVVDRVSDSSISFTYLPLKMKQHMDLPGVN
jgi:hypothetical protein